MVREEEEPHGPAVLVALDRRPAPGAGSRRRRRDAGSPPAADPVLETAVVAAASVVAAVSRTSSPVRLVDHGGAVLAAGAGPRVLQEALLALARLQAGGPADLAGLEAAASTGEGSVVAVLRDGPVGGSAAPAVRPGAASALVVGAVAPDGAGRHDHGAGGRGASGDGSQDGRDGRPARHGPPLAPDTVRVLRAHGWRAVGLADAGALPEAWRTLAAGATGGRRREVA